MEHVIEYTRNLPHIQPLNESFFITFRLHGCLPKNVILNLMEERIANEKKILKTIINKTNLQEKISNNYKRNFIKYDDLLHKYQTKNDLLINDIFANIVKDPLHYYDNKNYDLICYSIMPNHVHLIISNVNIQLFKILQSIKPFTARQINKEQNKSGKIWQRESYDHVVRKNSNINNYINYVIQNPVKAGLVNNSNKWKHNYQK